jgi:hypothetical protein
MSTSLPKLASEDSSRAARPGRFARLLALPGSMIAPAACLAGRLTAERPLPFLTGIPRD